MKEAYQSIGGDGNTLAFRKCAGYDDLMATITEIEKLALDLPDRERAVLAVHLIRSLPSVLDDEDEGVAEALRRDAELDADPSSSISLEQLERRRN